MYAGEGPARDRKRQNLFEVDTALSSPRMMPPAGEAPVPSGSVTGGTTPPNGEKVELMYFDHAGVNPFVATDDDALSTFAVDVDNASLDAGPQLPGPRRAAADGRHPGRGIRQRLRRRLARSTGTGPSGSTSTAGRRASARATTCCAWGWSAADGDGRASASRPTWSSSSTSPARWTARTAWAWSSGALRIAAWTSCAEGDRVGIVVYGSRGEVRLQPTDVVARAGRSSRAIDGLRPDGSTNAAEGLELAYAMARAGLRRRAHQPADPVLGRRGQHRQSTEAEEHPRAGAPRLGRRASRCRPSASAWATTTTC